MEKTQTHAMPGVAGSQVDDLKLIRGIGPGIANRLNKAGIFTFRQLGALTSLELAAFLDGMIGMTAERIQKEDWFGQAVELASAQPELILPTGENNSEADQLHYTTFTVEMLMDSHNHVRRTRAIHVQSMEERSWAGWENERLVAFISGQSGLTGAEEETPQTAALEGQVYITACTAIDPDAGQAVHLIPSGETSAIRLELDLSSVTGGPSAYHAAVEARRLGCEERIPLATIEEEAVLGKIQKVETLGNPLPPGTYRLEATVCVSKPGDGAGFTLKAFNEGELLQAF